MARIKPEVKGQRSKSCAVIKYAPAVGICMAIGLLFLLRFSTALKDKMFDVGRGQGMSNSCTKWLTLCTTA